MVTASRGGIRGFLPLSPVHAPSFNVRSSPRRLIVRNKNKHDRYSDNIYDTTYAFFGDPCRADVGLPAAGAQWNYRGRFSRGVPLENPEGKHMRIERHIGGAKQGCCVARQWKLSVLRQQFNSLYSIQLLPFPSCLVWMMARYYCEEELETRRSRKGRRRVIVLQVNTVPRYCTWRVK